MDGVTEMNCIMGCVKSEVKMMMDTGKKKIYQCIQCKQIWEDVTSNV